MSPRPLLARQRSEQYLTSSQTRAHFFRHANGRHANGRPHVVHDLLGKVDLVKCFGFSVIGRTSIGRNLARQTCAWPV
jgi:hypothetical protein